MHVVVDVAAVLVCWWTVLAVGAAAVAAVKGRGMVAAQRHKTETGMDLLAAMTRIQPPPGGPAAGAELAEVMRMFGPPEG